MGTDLMSFLNLSAEANTFDIRLEVFLLGILHLMDIDDCAQIKLYATDTSDNLTII